MHPGPPKNVPPVVIFSIALGDCIALPDFLAAICVGVTPSFMKDLFRSGEVRYKIFGNQRVVEIAELKRWFRKQPYHRGKMDLPPVKKIAVKSDELVNR